VDGDQAASKQRHSRCRTSLIREVNGRVFLTAATHMTNLYKYVDLSRVTHSDANKTAAIDKCHHVSVNLRHNYTFQGSDFYTSQFSPTPAPLTTQMYNYAKTTYCRHHAMEYQSCKWTVDHMGIWVHHMTEIR